MIDTLKSYLNSKSLVYLFYLLIGVGISLAIYQFLYNKCIWLDEAALAINIRDRGFIDLLKPLDHLQVAPIGFLYLEKLLINIFGVSEFTLRFFPLFSFLISIPLLYMVANLLVKNKTAALLTAAIFSTSLTLIIYSNEVKQYSSDILFTLIILYLTLTLNFQKTKHLLIYAFVGSITLWFSNISIIILFVSGLYLLLTEVYKKKNFKLMLVFFLWSISFLIYFYFFIYNHPHSSAMKAYWSSSFLSSDIYSWHFRLFIFQSIRNIYAYSFGFGPLWYLPAITTVFAIIMAIIHKRFALIYFFLLPIVVHLALSAQELYPFSGRLVLYSIPLWILVFSYGAFQFWKLILKRIPLASIPLFIGTIYMAYIYLSPLNKHIPYTKEEIRDGLKHIEKTIKPNDNIYIYYFAYPAWSFYEDKKFSTHNITYGKEHRKDPHKHNDELKMLTGKVWLFFSHSWASEEKYIIDFMVNHGAELLYESRFKASSIYYIDTKK